MINNQCTCGERYQFTEEDKKWATLNTVCPKCRNSLSAQLHTRLQQKVRQEGQKVTLHEGTKYEKQAHILDGWMAIDGSDGLYAAPKQ